MDFLLLKSKFRAKIDDLTKSKSYFEITAPLAVLEFPNFQLFGCKCLSCRAENSNVRCWGNLLEPATIKNR